MSYNFCVIYPTFSLVPLFAVDAASFSSPPYHRATSPLSKQAGPGTHRRALSGLPQPGRCSGGDAEWCQHGAQELSPLGLLCQQQSFWEASAREVTLRVSWLAEPREGSFAATAVGPASVWVTPPGCRGCCRDVLPSPTSCVHLRTPVGKVMTKGIDTQRLRQKFGAGVGNWYKWLQTSREAERVLNMWHRDLRDSCRELPPSVLLAESTNVVGQWPRSSHPFTSLPPSSIHRVSRSTSAPQPSPPECCCGRASARARGTVQKASVNYATVISHQRTHSLTAYGRWTNTCRLAGAEREADLFPELATLISPSWSCKAECASVIYFFFFRRDYVAVRSITKSDGIFGVFLQGRQEGGWKVSLLSIALEAAWIHRSMNWISKSQPCPVCADSWFASKGLQSPIKQGEKHWVSALGWY